MKKALVAAASLVLAVSPVLADDDWKEPKDGVLTEKEADGAVLVLSRQRKQIERYVAEAKARGEREPSVAEAMAQLRKVERDQEENVKAAGLTRREADWAIKVVSDTYVTLMGEELRRATLGKVEKEAENKLAEAEKKKAAASDARKAGRRVMTPEQKAAAKKDAEEDAKGYEAGPLKDCENGVKDAKQAVADREAELKKASDDDREGAKQAVEDAKNALKEREAALADARKELAAKKKRAADPDLPQNDDEKKAIDDENADREKQAQDEVDSLKKSLDMLRDINKEAAADEAKSLAKFPAKNVELVKARREKLDKETYLGVLTQGMPK